MISKNDLDCWTKFTEKNFQKANSGIGVLSDNSKNFLRKVKENIKNNQNYENPSNTGNQYFNGEFVLEKDKTLGIDANSDRKLLSGKYKIDSKIDLHGLTLNQAYDKVKLFFDNAILNNYKCILIVTGKGGHSINKTIKESINEWLQQPYFSSKIIKYTDASIKHGGSGAIYVLLKSK